LKLHPVFYINCLAPYWDNGLDKPPPPDSVTVEDKEEYKVDKITDSHIFHRQLQYRVKWKVSWRRAQHRHEGAIEEVDEVVLSGLEALTQQQSLMQ
jgi:hypothetical protein